jgi:hypothetical protein
MELSELVLFHGRLLTFDDVTGISELKAFDSIIWHTFTAPHLLSL